MNLTYKQFLVLIFVMLINNNIIAAPESFICKELKNGDAREDFWTPEKIQNAKPMPLPQAYINPGDAGESRDYFTSSRIVPAKSEVYYPYSTIGKMFATTLAGAITCTASVIGQRIILTAGHCVHNGYGGDAQGFFSNFMFSPAFRDGLHPYGQWSAAYVCTTKAWANSQRAVPNEADFGMIELKDQVFMNNSYRIGDRVGLLRYKLNRLLQNHADLFGYPGNLDHAEKMHVVTAQSARMVAQNNVEYGSDMGPGSSGGPIIQNFGEKADDQDIPSTEMNAVIGVISSGPEPNKQKVMWSSIPGFSFEAMYKKICAHRAGNCRYV